MVPLTASLLSKHPSRANNAVTAFSRLVAVVVKSSLKHVELKSHFGASRRE